MWWKSDRLKKKFRIKQRKQILPTKHNEKKIHKRKGKDKRKRKGKKGKGKRKGKASKKLGKIKKIKKKKKQTLSRKADAKSSRSAPIVGDICQFVDFFGARRMGTGCEDGSKLVISQRWVLVLVLVLLVLVLYRHRRLETIFAGLASGNSFWLLEGAQSLGLYRSRAGNSVTVCVPLKGQDQLSARWHKLSYKMGFYFSRRH